jgi:hypothetical protein
MNKLTYRLRKAINERIDTLTEIVTSGQLPHDEYKLKAGEIAGLKWALAELQEINHKAGDRGEDLTDFEDEDN